MMKVLITGASGLLGSRMLKAFPSHWQVTGTCHKHPMPGLVECSLDNSRSVPRLLREGGYDWAVHCAALRSPDACQRDPRRAIEVNSDGTEWVARAASDSGVRMAYASTDAVFGGDAPAYREDDRPSPVGVYGHSKLAGEQHALSVPGALVVRMPALFSLDLDAPNNVLSALRQSLEAGRPFAADDESVRYYTLAEDVAAAFAFLLDRSARGVVHVSAEEASTKRQFLQAAAAALGLDAGLVVPNGPDAGAAARPRDSHLDTTLYKSLGGPPMQGYSRALGRLRAALRGAAPV
jgi:dTDP-4-dehydrorhamnose reductase